MTVVTTTYRYKPPPRTRKTAPLAGPVIVTPERKLTVARSSSRPRRSCNDNRPEPKPASRPAIVTARRPGKRFADGSDLTLEELQRRGDAAAAMFRAVKRAIAAKIVKDWT